jgi:hypothetical protein
MVAVPFQKAMKEYALGSAPTVTAQADAGTATMTAMMSLDAQNVAEAGPAASVSREW